MGLSPVCVVIIFVESEKTIADRISENVCYYKGVITRVVVKWLLGWLLSGY